MTSAHPSPPQPTALPTTIFHVPCAITIRVDGEVRGKSLIRSLPSTYTSRESPVGRGICGKVQRNVKSTSRRGNRFHFQAYLVPYQAYLLRRMGKQIGTGFMTGYHQTLVGVNPFRFCACPVDITPTTWTDTARDL